MKKKPQRKSQRTARGSFTSNRSGQYWLSRSPEERFAEAWRLRQKKYGKKCSEPMRKDFYEIASLDGSDTVRYDLINGQWVRSMVLNQRGGPEDGEKYRLGARKSI